MIKTAWIATDKDGEIYLYPYKKPKRDTDVWEGETCYYLGNDNKISIDLAEHCIEWWAEALEDKVPIPKWEDEPLEIEIDIKIRYFES